MAQSSNQVDMDPIEWDMGLMGPPFVQDNPGFPVPSDLRDPCNDRHRIEGPDLLLVGGGGDDGEGTSGDEWDTDSCQHGACICIKKCQTYHAVILVYTLTKSSRSAHTCPLRHFRMW